jgi:WD40 repeat protein
MGVAMTLTPDGQTLVVGGIGNLSTWDLPTGRPRLSLKGHTGSITPFESLAFAPRGGLLASSGYDRTIRIWATATGNELHVLQGHEQTITNMAFADEGQRLLSGSFDNTIRFWDVASGKERRCLSDLGFGFGVCAISPDGRQIVVSQGNDMHLLDAASGREVRKWTIPSKSYGTAMAFSPTGRELFLWRYDSETLQVWDVETGRRLRQFPEDEPQGPPAGTARVVGWATFSPDGRWLAVKRSTTAGVELIDVRTGRMVRQFKIPPGRQDSQAFSADSRTFATGQGTVDDGLILLWETTTGQERLHLSGARQGWINSLAFSPDCRTLASGGVDTTVLLWDVTGLRNKPNVVALSDGELQKNWHDVSEGDAAAAYRAIWTLTTVPHQALPLLREKLKPVPRIPEERLQRLLGDLDSDTFSVREKAVAEFESLGSAAEPFLRRELKANHTLECRRRVEQLLERLDRQPIPGISLAEWRALELLEHIGTADAKQLLAKLAAGAPGATLTEEAKAALERRERLRE